MYAKNYLASRLRKGSLGLESKISVTASEFNIHISYSKLFSDCEKLANVMQSAGVGNRILYFAPKTIA